jgi:hypothetical protein
MTQGVAQPKALDWGILPQPPVGLADVMAIGSNA